MAVVKKVLLLCMSLIFIESCASSKVQQFDDQIYSVIRQKSNQGGSYLSLNFYHYNNKKEAIPAFFYINGIMFKPADNFKERVLAVRPGIYKIEAGYIGKKETQLKINVSKKDSVLVNIYLKDNPKPLH